MAESWTISVGGRVYGPYSLEQMQAFQAEKRLAGHSLIARAGQEQFQPAAEDPELAPLFAAADSQATSAPEPAPRFGQRQEVETDGIPGHFVIVADMKSRSITGLEDAIFSLGPAHRFGAQAWVLSSEASINIVRMALVQKLGKLDTLFIVDATHDKAAWFNFGPEADTRIRKMWSRPSDYQGPEKRILSRT
ncbi:MAG TPA: DUF4339 domain-containing protein [Rhizomicrobium sp.]|nr:DUF4339 domain-containing protein [Rhizomicrobium sp.]